MQYPIFRKSSAPLSAPLSLQQQSYVKRPSPANSVSSQGSTRAPVFRQTSTGSINDSRRQSTSSASLCPYDNDNRYQYDGQYNFLSIHVFCFSYHLYSCCMASDYQFTMLGTGWPPLRQVIHWYSFTVRSGWGMTVLVLY